MITVARACRHRLNVFHTSFNAEDFQSTEERQITLWLASDRSESGTHTHDGGGSGPTRLQHVVVDMLQGRSRAEKLKRKWLTATATTRRKGDSNVCCGGPEAWASRRWRSRALWKGERGNG